jgi:hypothetical protein
MSIMAIVGILIYAAYFSTTSFRKIFFWSQLVIALTGFLDIVLFKEWNYNVLRITDTNFQFITYIVSNFVTQFSDMPFFVLSAQLCPKGLEATFFATIMTLANAGLQGGSKFGEILVSFLKVETIDEETGEFFYVSSRALYSYNVYFLLMTHFFFLFLLFDHNRTLEGLRLLSGLALP